MIDCIANIHTCDNCRKPIPKWEVHSLVDRHYAPGNNFEKCSSNINAYSRKIIELCPDCIDEVYEMFGKKRESEE